MKARTLKVCDLWRGGHYYENLVPQIRLNGKWLQEAGFAIGDEVYVLPDEPGRLVIIASQQYSEEVHGDYALPKLRPPHGDSLRGHSCPAMQQLQLL